MDIRASIERLLNIQNPGIITSLVLLPLTLCSFLYGFSVFLRTFFYKLKILNRNAVSCRVISLGNITVGGTGKTPTVCWLAGCLKNEGFRTVVINRGYLGSRTQSVQVVSDGEKILVSAEEVGDEAFMLAEKLSGIPVLAGKDRVAAARIAVDVFNAQVVILDDGFQYLKLKKDLEIVLVNASNPFGNGFLLPRGTLREPLSALGRASLILLTKTDSAPENINELEERIAIINPDVRIFRSSFKPAGIKNVKTQQHVALDRLGGKKAVALCSIGDPANFFSTLELLNVVLLKKLVFSDHHSYDEDDYKTIDKWAQSSDCLITTEKDIAKINSDVIQNDKFYQLEIEQVVDNPELFLSCVKEIAGMG